MVYEKLHHNFRTGIIFVDTFILEEMNHDKE